MAEKPRLGRGLEALLSSRPTVRQEAARAAGEGVRKLPMAQIHPNPMQPRKEFREDQLSDLEASLRANGLIQPITVRTAVSGNGFEIVTGERRFRAAQRLNWAEIPAIVREI